MKGVKVVLAKYSSMNNLNNREEKIYQGPVLLSSLGYTAEIVGGGGLI